MDMLKSNTLSVRVRLFARDYVAWIYPPHQARSIARSLVKAASTTKAKANSHSSKTPKTPKNKSNMSEQIEKDKIYNCDCLEDKVSPDNTGETIDGKGKEAGKN